MRKYREERIRPRGNKRDTRKWCKGKVGVRHSLDWKIFMRTIWVWYCTKCGKKVRWWDDMWSHASKPDRIKELEQLRGLNKIK
jgi:hypothetical protein